VASDLLYTSEIPYSDSCYSQRRGVGGSQEGLAAAHTASMYFVFAMNDLARDTMIDVSDEGRASVWKATNGAFGSSRKVGIGPV